MVLALFVSLISRFSGHSEFPIKKVTIWSFISDSPYFPAFHVNTTLEPMRKKARDTAIISEQISRHQQEYPGQIAKESKNH